MRIRRSKRFLPGLQISPRDPARNFSGSEFSKEMGNIEINFIIHMPTIHLLIKGKVQGVNYRASAKEEALRLSITGWVKNTTAGEVEITATGSPSQLDSLMSWCRRGPTHARVAHVESTPMPETHFIGFEIRRGD
jgi:acylphosphatase